MINTSINLLAEQIIKDLFEGDIEGHEFHGNQYTGGEGGGGGGSSSNQKGPFYFGGSDLEIAKISERGISLSGDKNTARMFANARKGSVKEIYLDKNIKIISFNAIPKTALPKTGGLEGVYTAAAKWAKSNSYDAIDFGGTEKELRVVNPEVLKDYLDLQKKQTKTENLSQEIINQLFEDSSGSINLGYECWMRTVE